MWLLVVAASIFLSVLLLLFSNFARETIWYIATIYVVIIMSSNNFARIFSGISKQ